MPVFNAERYLGAAIESITRQSFSDFELIVIDDGSADASLRIIQDRGSRDNRIIARSRERTGVARARNDAVTLAAGRFVAFLDADDVAEPGRLELQHDALEHHPGCVGLGGQILFMDREGCPIFRSDFPVDHESIDTAHMGGAGCVLSQGTSALSRDAVLKVGGYRAQYQVAEDLDLLLRLAEIGRLANLTETLIRCRLHAESLTQTHLDTGHRFAAAAIQEARARRGLPPTDVRVPAAHRRPARTEFMHRAMKAHQSGFQKTAMKYVFRSILKAPSDPTTWRVALVVLFSARVHQFRRFLGNEIRRP
jgi:glycosyltransferase involved in cell wall biosynthesis